MESAGVGATRSGESGGSRPRASQSSQSLPHQRSVSRWYNSDAVQILVASIIILNFLANIVEKQIDPYAEKYDDTFRIFELIFNILFTIELIINVYAHWFCRFWESAWNWFDVIVVSIGLVTTVFRHLPKALSLLRMMRAFRVFRLFKRVKSLNKIIATIIYAVPLVMNAFLILAIVMSIYAILAVEFYRDLDSDCHTTGFGITKYGGCFGQEYFGRFGLSLYTFFQVLTGESWAEAVARPAIFHYMRCIVQHGGNSTGIPACADVAFDARRVGSGLFFTSFFIIASIVLANVVTTVLLDKILDPAIAAKAEAECKKEKEDAPEEDVPPSQETMSPMDAQLETLDAKVSQLTGANEKMRNQLAANMDELAKAREQIERILETLSQEAKGTKE